MEIQTDDVHDEHELSYSFKIQNDDFGDRLKTWLTSLPIERRVTALSIHDSAFLSTLLYFASLSLSRAGRREDPTEDCKTKIDGGANLPPTCNWSEVFTLSHIEKVFEGYRQGQAVELKSITDNHTIDTLEFPKSNMDDSGEKNNQFVSSESSDYFNHPSEILQGAVGVKEEDRIRSSNSGTDAVRIERSEKEQIENKYDIPMLAPDGSEKNSPYFAQHHLSKTCLIFPCIIRAAREYGIRDIINQVDDVSSPILSLPFSVLKHMDLSELSLGAISESGSDSWISLLRGQAQTNSLPHSKGELSASLSLMMLARIQFSACAAFAAQIVQDDMRSKNMNDSAAGEEQYVFEQFSTPQEDVLDTHVEEMDPAFPAVNRSNHVPCNSRKKQSISGSEFYRDSMNAKTVLGFAEVIKKFTHETDLEKLRSLGLDESGLEDLPLVPLDSILQFDQPPLETINAELKKLLEAALQRAAIAGCLSGQTKKKIKETSVIVARSEEEKVDSLFEDSQQSISWSNKKKKKKKKKRKKASNAGLQQENLFGSGASNSGLLQENVFVASVASKEFCALSLPAAEAIPAKNSNLCNNPIKQDTFNKYAPQGVMPNELLDKDGVSQAQSGDSLSCARSSNENEDSSVTLSRIADAGPSVSALGSLNNSKSEEVDEKLNEVTVETVVDNEDDWETVEAKGKNKNRNKLEFRNYSGMSHHQSSYGGQRKAKLQRTSASRRRTANRRMVRDILTSVLDAVDVEVRRRRKSGDAKMYEDRRRRAAPNGRKRVSSLFSGASNTNTFVKPLSMRDVVIGKQPVAVRKSHVLKSFDPVAMQRRSPDLYSGSVRADLSDTQKKEKAWSKGTQTVNNVADQSIAPTLPETLSGTSANTQSSFTTEEVDNAGRTPASLVDDSSSLVDCEYEEVEPTCCNSATNDVAESSPPPPLPTLLGPGNTNSATSSVASSLEAPHASSHRHHHSSGCSENDVGYHLLDVCDRLSRDMNVFMARRAAALTARRLERGALLAALQDTVSNIWSDRGKVEMYGSCATQLDLPSSDLDAVILGLDVYVEARVINGNLHASKTFSKKQQRQIPGGELNVMASPVVPSPHTATKLHNTYGHHQSMVMHQYGYQSNGERVMLLAAELERQSWAVQVKAIPTASVPVVKILADPSKLPGAVSSFGAGGDWMLQQHHIAAQAAAVAAGVNRPPVSSRKTTVSPPSPLPQGQAIYQSHTPPPWRGADVMNGLFSLDITFEGPEHGGLGSTAYSSEIIRQACKESGLPPDRTPFVQVLMVLKELLAQRRLNEPFSGGLSSYALLLLVNAVLKERAIIREEMERMERHRELVAASDASMLTDVFDKVNGQFQPEPGTQTAITATTPRKGTDDELSIQDSEKLEPANYMTSKITKPSACFSGAEKTALRQDSSSVASSWATIARKNSGQQLKKPPTAQGRVAKSAAQKSQGLHAPPKVTSFAEAVSRKQEAVNSAKGSDTKKQPRMSRGERNDIQLDSNTESKSTASTVQTGTKSNVKDRDQTKLTKQSQSTQTVLATQSQKNTTLRKESKPGLNSDNKINSFLPHEDRLTGAPSLFPQGSNDVLEVLCSGETTAGKLLMHFLLYYGEHFDSRTTAIDVTGSCNPDRPLHGMHPFSAHLSPYILRSSGGSIDPITGMLTVDPIVVYDPWEGGHGNNVARSCYAWSSIRWHFAQCYMTLSSAVERSGDISTSAAFVADAPINDQAVELSTISDTSRITQSTGSTGNNAALQPQPLDVSPLLELLLSF